MRRALPGRSVLLLLLVGAADIQGLNIVTSHAARGPCTKQLHSGRFAQQPQATAAGQPQELTMEDVRAMFRDVRAHYRSTGDVEEAQACRNLMTTRVKDFDRRISRCSVRPSPLHGNGLFATRDIAEGDLVSFFPADALLIWEGGDRKLNDCMMLFGAHIPQEERDAKCV